MKTEAAVAEEGAEFKQMLDEVNLIYIGMRVLILVDLSCAPALLNQGHACARTLRYLCRA